LCRKFLLHLVNLKIFNFLKKITKKQQYFYIVIVFIVAMISLRFAEYLYHLEGLDKLFVFFVLILFFIGATLNGLKIIIDNIGDFKNKYLTIYYCIQLITIQLVLAYFICKFIKLTFSLVL